MGEGVNGLLTQNAIEPALDAAVQNWIDTGLLTQAQIANLYEIEISITDLDGATLGAEADGAIALDEDAAVHGWYVDRTPGKDVKYDAEGRAMTRDASTGIDLVSVLTHELGHVLGFDHDLSDGSWMGQQIADGGG